MNSFTKKLSKDTLTYSFSEFLGKFIGLLMVPVYTFYLSPHDYGVLSLLLQFNYIVAIFVGLGLEQSIMKFYHDAKGHLELSRTMSTIILSMTMLSSIVLLVLG